VTCAAVAAFSSKTVRTFCTDSTAGFTLHSLTLPSPPPVHCSEYDTMYYCSEYDTMYYCSEYDTMYYCSEYETMY